MTDTGREASADPYANMVAAIQYAMQNHPIFDPKLRAGMAVHAAEVRVKMAALGWLDEEDGDE